LWYKLDNWKLQEKSMPKKKQMSKYQARQLHTRQIIFAVISVIIILSMVLAYIAK